MALTLPIFPVDLYLPLRRVRQRPAVAQSYEGGAHQARPRWSRTKVRWESDLGALTLAERSTLITFFDTVRGQVDPFLLWDAQESVITAEAVGTGDGAQTVFYLDHKNIKSGTIKVGGVAKTAGVDYTLDQDTGVITFLGGHIPAAAAAVTADYEFYFKVRFLMDELEDVTYSATAHGSKVSIEEYWP